MSSWMTDWAEKGGSLLNQLDSRVASLLKNDANEEGKSLQYDELRLESPTKIIEPPKPPNVPSAPVREEVNSRLTSSAPSKAVPITEASDTQLFEFLNSSAPMEQAITALKPNSSPLAAVHLNSLQSKPVESSKPVDVSEPPKTATLVAKNGSDVEMENRLLHQEVASLNQEIAELMKQNKRAKIDAQQHSKEIHGLRDQVQHLKALLEESKKKALEQDNSTSSNGEVAKSNVIDLEQQIEKLTRILASTRQAHTESENKASEALKLAELSSSRAEQLQHEVSRLRHSLASYKE
ncbi:unnamed protein product, partial [Rodentolepis nana]|uniref:Golgin-84 n=1 Tax=Rodentolepis nana TaxID=102285 RepID=A0A0R3THL2_RODNA